MAGSLCLPNGRISTPGSESYPFQVHSPIHPDMNSKMLVKQRPKTDVFLEPPQMNNNRPKTAKIKVANFKSPVSDAVRMTNREPFSRNITVGVRSGRVNDYLSQTCNDIEVSDDDLGIGDGGGVLRDDEEYYMNMDPVEYFYSPIIDIFPISSYTTRMTSTYPSVIENSLHSTSHFLPLIDNGHESLHVNKATNKEDIEGNNQLQKSSVSSRKSSVVNSPLQIVPSKMFSLNHTTSEKLSNHDKFVLPEILHEKSMKDERMEKGKQGNGNTGTLSVRYEPNCKNDTLKAKSKIPVAKNVVFKENPNTKTESKLQPKQSIWNGAKMFKRKPEAFGQQRQISEQDNQNYVSVKSETRINITELHENGGKVVKLTRDREKTVVLKEKKTFMPSNIAQVHHDSHRQRDTDQLQKRTDIQKDKEDKFWASSSKRLYKDNYPFNKEENKREKMSGISFIPDTSTKLLSDSTVALTSSKRPFTYDRVLMHKEDKEIFPPFKKEILQKTNVKSKRRPQSDKLNIAGIPTAPIHHQRELRPLKVRFHKMNF